MRIFENEPVPAQLRGRLQTRLAIVDENGRRRFEPEPLLRELEDLRIGLHNVAVARQWAQEFQTPVFVIS